MWANEMTLEQRRAYGFKRMTELEMRRIGYKPVLRGWRKVNKRGEVHRVFKESKVPSI